VTNATLEPNSTVSVDSTQDTHEVPIASTDVASESAGHNDHDTTFSSKPEITFTSDDRITFSSVATVTFDSEKGGPQTVDHLGDAAAGHISGEEHHSELHESSHEDTLQLEVVACLFVLLLLGQFFKHIANVTPIPYTPMITILGIIIGLTPLGEITAIEVIQNLDPHVILLIFIPPLIFESAYNSDWHVFKK